MTDYERAFSTLAERGRPLGTTALIERLERDLATRAPLPSDPVRTRRRIPGFAIGATALVAVVVAGLVWASLIGIPGRVTDPDAIDWVEVELEFTFQVVTAGPGGFLRQGHASVEFSQDGRTWTLVDDPRLAPPLSLEVSKSTWVAETSGPDAGLFLSTDGRTWEQIQTPPDLRGRVVAGAAGFLAPFGSSVYWSEDGRTWQAIEVTGLPDVTDFSFNGTIWGGDKGFVACCWVASDRATLFSSTDGTTWVESELSVPDVGALDSVGMSTPHWIGDRWIADGWVATQTELRYTIWVSTDGVTWDLAPVPSFLVQPEGIATPIGSFVAAGRLTIVIASYDESRDLGTFRIPTGSPAWVRAWSTRDGLDWEPEGSLDRNTDAVVGVMVEDRIIGLLLDWPSEASSSDVVGVATTTPTVPAADLEQEGLALQDEILADGVVTRDEYEQALSGWQECMESRGVDSVGWSIDGGRGYGSRDGRDPERENTLCEQSYLRRVEATWTLDATTDAFPPSSP